MNQIGQGAATDVSSASMQFAGRPASQGWEAVKCREMPSASVWVWYKPPHLPLGLVVNIPDATYAAFAAHHSVITMRMVMRWLQLPAGCVWQWMQHGQTHDGQQGSSPQFDQPLSAAAPGSDSGIGVVIYPPIPPMMPPHAGAPMATVPTSAPPPGASPPAAAAPAGAEQTEHGDIFEIIAWEYKSIEKTERDLGLCRKKLSDIMSRLGSLNRDLNHEEMMHSDSGQKQAWQDARRALRDAHTRVSRNLKDCDVGDATSVAKRDWMEKTYETYIEPRVYFDGIDQAHREFEGYRKLVQTLLVNMNTAYAAASADGERRAQQILSQIAAKVRRARKK